MEPWKGGLCFNCFWACKVHLWRLPIPILRWREQDECLGKSESSLLVRNKTERLRIWAPIVFRNRLREWEWETKRYNMSIWYSKTELLLQFGIGRSLLIYFGRYKNWILWDILHLRNSCLWQTDSLRLLDSVFMPPMCKWVTTGKWPYNIITNTSTWAKIDTPRVLLPGPALMKSVYFLFLITSVFF